MDGCDGATDRAVHSVTEDAALRKLAVLWFDIFKQLVLPDASRGILYQSELVLYTPSHVRFRLASSLRAHIDEYTQTVLAALQARLGTLEVVSYEYSDAPLQYTIHAITQRHRQARLLYARTILLKTPFAAELAKRTGQTPMLYGATLKDSCELIDEIDFFDPDFSA